MDSNECAMRLCGVEWSGLPRMREYPVDSSPLDLTRPCGFLCHYSPATKDGQANSDDALLCPAQLERSQLFLPLTVALVAQRSTLNVSTLVLGRPGPPNPHNRRIQLTYDACCMQCDTRQRCVKPTTVIAELRRNTRSSTYTSLPQSASAPKSPMPTNVLAPGNSTPCLSVVCAGGLWFSLDPPSLRHPPNLMFEHLRCAARSADSFRVRITVTLCLYQC